ncbi:MAG TPA: 2Fe-2S iron-sulfur cluster-binding protein [Polyangiaceae bacterium]|jgi:adenylate cyclase
MPVIVFESSCRAPVVAEVDEAVRLVDVCDEAAAPVPFSCRSASCGTCRIEVVEGAELLEPPEDDELEVLDLFGDDPAHMRLACQVKVRAAAGRLTVRVADESLLNDEKE